MAYLMIQWGKEYFKRVNMNIQTIQAIHLNMDGQSEYGKTVQLI